MSLVATLEAERLDSPPGSAARTAAAEGVLARLGRMSQARGLSGLAGRLDALLALVGDELAGCERELLELRGERAPGRVQPRSLVELSAAHLLARGGKRLRPLCVALASRVGTRRAEGVLELAVAVELVHAATLLHDDVVDLGETRRGAPAARLVYGNAASIFAGDWLLVSALQRVQRAGVPGALDRLLEVIEEMIAAESEQLERRGRIDADREAYFRVTRGKTAALFRWAMWAGGSAGGLDGRHCAQLEDYGQHLGVAFQAVDDVLDLAGDPEVTGKALFSDLREGKMTYPVMVALERAPALRGELEAFCQEAEVPPQRALEVRRAIVATRALEACGELARERAAQAVEALAGLPEGQAVQALRMVAAAVVARDH
jgi:octaprenyl-diphosphate synthase